jgi:hypothetical protein
LVTKRFIDVVVYKYIYNIATTCSNIIQICTNIIYLDASKFDNKNRLKVTPQLLIAGETNIYAIGDCCNTSEEKLAAHACAHARTVAHNIWKDIKGKEKKTYRQSKCDKKKYYVSLLPECLHEIYNVFSITIYC